ncbi:MAG: hypothetical protein F7C07_06005, partial [Desulfurococcales archaeon]|nr:hypothetical protein [Desulfurococcales archaeon]
MLMKYGLLVSFTENLGEEIQSLAALQYLPRVDYLLLKDYIGKFRLGEKLKVIMNGWFINMPKNWPPSPDIIPLFISFHIHPGSVWRILDQRYIGYLKKHEPIGARDLFTYTLLKNFDIESYFSGCLTLTLDYKFSKLRDENLHDKIVYVDIPDNIITSLPSEWKKNSIFLT